MRRSGVQYSVSTFYTLSVLSGATSARSIRRPRRPGVPPRTRLHRWPPSALHPPCAAARGRPPTLSCLPSPPPAAAVENRHRKHPPAPPSTGARHLRLHPTRPRCMFRRECDTPHLLEAAKLIGPGRCPRETDPATLGRVQRWPPHRPSERAAGGCPETPSSSCGPSRPIPPTRHALDPGAPPRRAPCVPRRPAPPLPSSVAPSGSGARAPAGAAPRWRSPRYQSQTPTSSRRRLLMHPPHRLGLPPLRQPPRRRHASAGSPHDPARSPIRRRRRLRRPRAVRRPRPRAVGRQGPGTRARSPRPSVHRTSVSASFSRRPPPSRTARRARSPIPAPQPSPPLTAGRLPPTAHYHQPERSLQPPGYRFRRPAPRRRERVHIYPGSLVPRPSSLVSHGPRRGRRGSVLTRRSPDQLRQAGASWRTRAACVVEEKN